MGCHLDSSSSNNKYFQTSMQQCDTSSFLERMNKDDSLHFEICNQPTKESVNGDSEAISCSPIIICVDNKMSYVHDKDLSNSENLFYKKNVKMEQEDDCAYEMP